MDESAQRLHPSATIPPPAETVPPPPPVGPGAIDAFTASFRMAAQGQQQEMDRIMHASSEGDGPGPQPTRPGPYHAVVRGPDGLDVNISGSAEVVGAQLRGLAEVLAPRPGVTRRG